MGFSVRNVDVTSEVTVTSPCGKPPTLSSPNPNLGGYGVGARRRAEAGGQVAAAHTQREEEASARRVGGDGTRREGAAPCAARSLPASEERAAAASARKEGASPFAVQELAGAQRMGAGDACTWGGSAVHMLHLLRQGRRPRPRQAQRPRRVSPEFHLVSITGIKVKMPRLPAQQPAGYPTILAPDNRICIPFYYLSSMATNAGNMEEDQKSS
uniref:Uncharacterized protein n=1 Tax=Oryza punctata TaxID=4537 RepID=A0A0E0LYJ6_ORYPU